MGWISDERNWRLNHTPDVEIFSPVICNRIDYCGLIEVIDGGGGGVTVNVIK